MEHPHQGENKLSEIHKIRTATSAHAGRRGVQNKIMMLEENNVHCGPEIFHLTKSFIGQDGDILNKVKINKTSSTCPPTHSLFADKCVAPSKNNTRLNFAYSPMANVCPTFCNEFGCQWLPDNTTTSVVVCIEDELPICAADWKVTGNEKCHL